jgi:hypothetical protein
MPTEKKAKAVTPLRAATDALIAAVRAKDSLRIDAAFENFKRVVNG